jgi:hypothetical protein
MKLGRDDASAMQGSQKQLMDVCSEFGASYQVETQLIVRSRPWMQQFVVVIRSSKSTCQAYPEKLRYH